MIWIMFLGAVISTNANFSGDSWAGQGDVNDDGIIGLGDAILALKVVTGIPPQSPLETFTNPLGMTFMRISPGTFIMGSPANELGRSPDEVAHEETLTQPFYMQTTEVTQGQWLAMTGGNPSYFSECGKDCPVENVSWNDVAAFVQMLNQSEGGNHYRIPTEAEWEYAARAGTHTDIAAGDLKETDCVYDAALDSVGWYCGNAGDRTHPVAQKSPNAWGLFDMHGNVWEWCRDFYDPADAEGPVTDPTGAHLNSNRVNRGGGWSGDARTARSADRDSCTPDVRSSDLGFRLVWEP